MIAVASQLRRLSSRLAQWHGEAIKDWEKVPAEDREVLSKYARMLLKKLKDEPFPEKDKKILRRHANNFLAFMKEVD